MLALARVCCLVGLSQVGLRRPESDLTLSVLAVGSGAATSVNLALPHDGRDGRLCLGKLSVRADVEVDGGVLA